MIRVSNTKEKKEKKEKTKEIRKRRKVAAYRELALAIRSWGG